MSATNHTLSSDAASSPWLARKRPSRQTALRLFCFPYAGGGASIFRAWSEELPESVEICPVHLPGRGFRLSEEPYKNIEPLVEALADALLPHLDKPFAFFGHSMGALVSFELACELRRRHGIEPAHLFVAGRIAPQMPDLDPPLHTLPEQQLMDELRRLNGTPMELLEHPELMELMMPALRADFSVCETYTYREAAPLNCKITVLGGLQDHDVSREGLEGWREQTSAGISLRMLPGDHFFLQTSQALLLQLLKIELFKLLGSLKRDQPNE